MKKNVITKYILYFVAFTALYSCDDILEQEPANYISDGAIIKDKSSAIAALNGAYNRLGANSYYGGQYFVAGVNLASDNVSWTGSLNFYYAFDTHQYSAENQLLSYAWYAIYATINQSNQVIERVSKLSNIDESTKSQIIAEATIIRSLAFFDLGRTWGNVPLIRQATTSPQQFAGEKQKPYDEVLKEVVSDILSVYDALPASASRSHVSKPVADAFLARVYLYQENWTKAEEYATKLIDNNNYSLVDLQNLITKKLSEESIWELAYSSANTNQQSYYWRSSNDGGRHEWGLSKEIVKLLSDPSIGGERKIYFEDQSSLQVPDYYVGTFYYRSTNDDPVFLFRLSEQYLIRAEARVKKQNPDLAGALSDLNAVRDRAKISDFQSNNRDEIILAIENENRVEFALEPHRWFDLKRTGRAESILGIKKYQTIFPIPYSDIVADADLVQNEGY